MFKPSSVVLVYIVENKSLKHRLDQAWLCQFFLIRQGKVVNYRVLIYQNLGSFTQEK